MHRDDDDTRSPASAYAKALAAAALGVAFGLAATYFATARNFVFDAATSGAWSAWPTVGAVEVDPYAQAIMARHAEIPLGNGEGILFLASTDDTGRNLDGACDYRIEGLTPVARFWSVTLHRPDGQLLSDPALRHATNSANTLRQSNAPLSIVVAPSARAGVWLASERGRSFVVVLRLYDASVSPNHAALESVALPSIRRVACS